MCAMSERRTTAPVEADPDDFAGANPIPPPSPAAGPAPAWMGTSRRSSTVRTCPRVRTIHSVSPCSMASPPASVPERRKADSTSERRSPRASKATWSTVTWN